jgi:hypothetical protein
MHISPIIGTGSGAAAGWLKGKLDLRAARVHSVGGWALWRVIVTGPRVGKYTKSGRFVLFPA